MMLKRTVTMMCFITFFMGCSHMDKNVAITVNGKSILKSEIINAAEMMKQTILSTFPEKSVEGLPVDLSKEAAQQLVANKLMIEEAKKRNILIPAAVIDETYNKFKSRFADTTVFNKQLLEAGQTEAKIRAEMEQGAMLDSLLKIVMQEIDSVGEQECLNFYESNRSNFTGAPRIRVSQIFLKADSTDKIKWEDAKKRAQNIINQIKAGKNFGVLAAKFDEGPGRNTLGDIGWFKKGDLKAELEDPLHTISVGAITDLISSEAGFHILMKTEEETSHFLPFEEVKDDIRNMMSMKKQSDNLKNFIDSLKSKATVVYYDTLFR